LVDKETAIVLLLEELLEVRRVVKEKLLMDAKGFSAFILSDIYQNHLVVGRSERVSYFSSKIGLIVLTRDLEQHALQVVVCLGTLERALRCEDSLLVALLVVERFPWPCCHEDEDFHLDQLMVERSSYLQRQGSFLVD
jgi:hypothetical protein